MNQHSSLPPRRAFLRVSGSALAASSLSSRPAQAAPSPGHRLHIGMIGIGGMGMNHLRKLVQREDAAVTWVCDVDAQRLAEAAGVVEKETGRAPQSTGDLRRVLDDAAVDAVFMATPDHWHAPGALLALEAGKHVYVEKPCSHNIREGRWMLDAARRAGKIVQVGTQSRSTADIRKAMDRLREGAIGEVLVAKAWNSQRRGSIGRSQPAEPPPHLDFQSWLGPAPETPYRPNLLPSVWRWWHAFGTGDMGNDGVHDIDIARWGLGVDTHPNRVAALGGKYAFDDDMEFPDTQTVLFEYERPGGKPPLQLIFEMRIWSPYVQEGHENGDAFYGTEGYLILGKQKGWQLFGPRNELRETVEGGGPDLDAHHADFFRAVREGGVPNGDIAEGHLSAALCHLGNLAIRAGRSFRFDPAAEDIVDLPEARPLLGRAYRDHWARPTQAS